MDDQRIAVQTRRLRVAPGINAEESQFKIIVGLKCTVLNQTDIDTGSPARIEIVCVNSAAGDCRVGEQQLPVRTCAMKEHRTGTNSPCAARITTVVGTTLTSGLNDRGAAAFRGVKYLVGGWHRSKRGGIDQGLNDILFSAISLDDM